MAGYSALRRYAAPFSGNAAARKLVALHRLYGKAGGLLLGLSLVAWKRHPLPSDLGARLARAYGQRKWLTRVGQQPQRRPGGSTRLRGSVC